MNKIFSLLVIMLMSLAANAEKTITWDYNTIKGINFDINDYVEDDIVFPIISKNGITMSYNMGIWGKPSELYFQDCNLGIDFNSLYYDSSTIHFISTVGNITSIAITCSDGGNALWDEEYYGWTTSKTSLTWHGDPAPRVSMPFADNSEITGITQIIFTVDGAATPTYTISDIPDGWKVNGSTTNGTCEVKEGAMVIFTPANIPAGKKIKSVSLVEVTSSKYTSNLFEKSDGTWVLGIMPDYNGKLVVKYNDNDNPVTYYTISNIPDGWKVNGSTTGGTYNAGVGLSVIFTPTNIPAGKKIKSMKVVDLISDKTTNLTDNGDGTWTLAAMPDYDVKLVVEYEDIPEVYTNFDEETGTLTYYCDFQRGERTGITELYDPVNDPDAVRFTGYYKKVTKAVIDPSMKNAPLTSMRSMFNGGVNPHPLVIYNLSNMTDIEGLENLNTANVTDMCDMFSSCSSLTMLNLSTFNTDNVTNMYSMFMGCSELQMVDVSSFDISKVTKMGLMFGGCPKLETICCSNDWSNTSADSYVMFSGNYKLVGGKGTPFDSNVLDATYARPDGGTSKPGYFTEKPSLQGDLNGDGKVDIADAVTVLNIMASGEYNADADLNGDKKVDIADFVTILNIMAAQ